MAQAAQLPKFIQISEMLIRQIAAGHLADGARLPPERDMADDLGISVGTLRKALADVADKGMLDRVQGSGNYVRHRAATASLYAFFRLERPGGGGLPSATVLSVDRLPKPDAFAALGGAPDGHRIRRIRALDGQDIALEEIWLDAGLRDRIAVSDLSVALYHFYRVELGLVIATVEDRIGIGPMPPWTPPDYHIASGTTVGYIQRIGRTSAGQAAEMSFTWYDPGRAQYISRMGKG